MNSLIVFYWLIFLINHVPDAISMNGGSSTKLNQFEYLVSIWHRHNYACGGVIIDKNHVLTIARCVCDIPLSDLWLIAGKPGHSHPLTQLLKIITSWIHPHSHQVINLNEPNKIYWTNDIAIIEVSNDFEWSSTVNPVKMLPNDWNRNKECVIPGWQHIMTPEEQLIPRWTSGKILTKEQYFRLNKNSLPNTEFITAPVLLNKDVGSPLVCGDVLMGLIVQGGETIDEPSTVLKISPYYEFITAAITNGENHSKPREFAIVISIWHKNELICGGVIIDSTRILTISHCIPDKYFLPDLHISYTYESNGHLAFEFLPVSKVERHRKIKANSNVAIIWLKTSLKWSTSSQPAVFASEENASPLYCHIFRWIPRMPKSSPSPDQLIWSSVIILEVPEVEKLVLPLKQFFVADGDLRGSSSDEDRGYPLVCSGIVVGIISDTFSRTKYFNFPTSLVLDIVPYIKFIKRIL